MYQLKPETPTLPKTLEQAGQLLGVSDPQHAPTLEGIQEAQQLLASWIVAAAEERWPALQWDADTMQEQVCAAMQNAWERWPWAKSLADALNAAERYLLENDRRMLA